MIKYLFIFVLFIASGIFRGQDSIVFKGENFNLNTSIADQFSIYTDASASLEIEDIIVKDSLTFESINRSLANLDFTTKNYWIHFVLVNDYDFPREIILETARPITNTVELYHIGNNGNEISIYKSGDGIPFTEKQMKQNGSYFRIYMSSNQTKEYWLKLGSDGEVITLPMTFWDKDTFEVVSQRNQFFSGIFYGVFLFVIVIYLTFYILLKEISFLLYIFYVFFSGMLQFFLDGYGHQYFFKSGGYLTQHSVLIVAGFTVMFVLQYASNYLKIKEQKNKLYLISNVFTAIVGMTMLLSLIPGFTYKISYPLINGFSLLAMFYIVFLAINSKLKKQEVHPLFLTGVIILIIGAIIFILGNFGIIDAPNITQVALKVATLIEILFLSIVMAGKYKQLQKEKEQAQATLLTELEGINVKLEAQVKERTKEIELKSEELEMKNKDILSSIKYAERIQRALLPSNEKIKLLLPESFVFFKPRDIVSGDFFWIESVYTENKDQLIVYATADCTGHGVPGAFVSIVSSNLLNISKTNNEINTPAEALDFLNLEINKTFNSQYSEQKIRDGMDVALCALDMKNRKLLFSGAKNPIYIVRNGELTEYKGDKQPVGFMGDDTPTPFNNTEIDLEKDDIIYSFSDGFADQFGGAKQRKYMYKRFKELLTEISVFPMEKQKEVLEETFENWKGDLEQLDDVLIIGVKII